jgi:hypothetical protein
MNPGLKVPLRWHKELFIKAICGCAALYSALLFSWTVFLYLPSIGDVVWPGHGAIISRIEQMAIRGACLSSFSAVVFTLAVSTLIYRHSKRKRPHSVSTEAKGP